MFRNFLMILAILFVADSAYATAYDDFADGVAAYERGDAGRAITALTAALSSPDLAPNLLVTAYFDRGRAYLITGSCENALADLDAARKLNANVAETAEALAATQVCLRDFKAADEAYTSLIAANPRWQYFWERGRARWVASDFAGAAADFATVVSAKPDYAYPVLWLAMTQARISAVDNAVLERHADQLDLDKWPGMIVKLYLGKVTQQDVDVAASANTGDKCESDFYIGEWQIHLNDHSNALSSLHAAADKCPQNFIEREAAKAEIMRIR